MSPRRKAKFAKAAYMIGKTDGVTTRSKKEVAALLNDIGVLLEPDMSDRSISTLYEPKTNTYHISHKGTQFGSSTGNAVRFSKLAVDFEFIIFPITANATSCWRPGSPNIASRTEGCFCAAFCRA